MFREDKEERPGDSLLDLAIKIIDECNGSGVVGQKLQGLRKEWVGRMGDRVPTLPRTGVWREGVGLSKGKEFVSNKILWEGLAAGRNPGIINVLFCVWGLGGSRKGSAARYCLVYGTRMKAHPRGQQRELP